MKNSVFLPLFFLSLSININSQWVQVSNGLGNTEVYSFAVNGNHIFAGTLGDSVIAGVYLSSNNGTNWVQAGLQNHQTSSLAVGGIYIFAGKVGGYYPFGVYRSANNGGNWIQSGLSDNFIYSLAVNGDNIFAGTMFSGVYKSTNNGNNWIQAGLNFESVSSLAANASNTYAGTYGDGVYKSTDNGTTWTQTSLNNRSISSLAVNGNNIFAGCDNYPDMYGVYRSTDNGITWTQTTLNNQVVYSLAVIGINVFAGTSNATGFYVSTNNGANWLQRNEGLSNLPVKALCISNNYIFAGTVNNGVYRRPLSEIIGVIPISNEVPVAFSLEQNYPNPFNPVTKIRFQIPKSGFVNVKVYDVLGMVVTTLVNEQMQPGTYEAEWDGSNYPSGVYLYKLTAGDASALLSKGFTEMKKMILIK